MVKPGKEGKVYSDYNEHAPHKACWDLLLGTQPPARPLQEGLTPPRTSAIQSTLLCWTSS